MIPARFVHVLWSTIFFLLLVSCRDQANRPDREDSVALPATPIPGQQDLGSGDRALHSQEITPPPASTDKPGMAPLAPVEETGPTTRQVVASASRFSRKSEVYDRRGEAFKLLQSPKSAMQTFPADAQGKVDWVAALAQGLIQPRASLSAEGTMRRRFDDIVMRETRDMPWVKFPHAQHTEWLDCANCHPAPFSERKGSNQISMDSIMRGQHCGTCHDRVAFSIFACERCHSIPHAGSPAKWW